MEGGWGLSLRTPQGLREEVAWGDGVLPGGERETWDLTAGEAKGLRGQRVLGPRGRVSKCLR